MPSITFPNLSCSCGSEDFDLTDADIIKNLDDLNCDLTHEFRLYNTLREDLQTTMDVDSYKSMYPSMEEFTFTSVEGVLETFREHKLEALGYVVTRILAKCFNAVLRTMNFTASLIMDYGMTYTASAKIWDTYLKMRMRAINRDLLEGVQEETFQYEFLQQATQVSLRAFQFCMQLETICTDTSSTVITSRMKDITKELNTIGVVPSLVRGKVDISKLMDERRFGDLVTLGYDASLLPNMIRYCKELSSGVLDLSKGKLSPVQMKFDAFSKRISDEVELINEAISDGTLTKNSKEYRSRMDRLMLFTNRLAYCSQILEAGCSIANICAKDLKNMFYRIQVALTKID